VRFGLCEVEPALEPAEILPQRVFLGLDDATTSAGDKLDEE